MEEAIIFPGSQLGMLLQLIVAMGLGMALGAERAIAGKTAGMRTYSLVSMGSCLFIIISVVVTNAFLGVVSFDPLRMAASVVTGIGFIGAGIIIFRETTLRGLTTAAGLWVAAAIGIAVGFKLYLLAVFATVLTLFVFSVMWYLENHLEARWKFYGSDSPKTAVVSKEKGGEENGDL